MSCRREGKLFSHMPFVYYGLFCRYLCCTLLDAQDFSLCLRMILLSLYFHKNHGISIKIMRKQFLCIIYLLSQRFTTMSSEIFSKKRLYKESRLVFFVMIPNLKLIKSELFCALFNKKKHSLSGILRSLSYSQLFYKA